MKGLMILMVVVLLGVGGPGVVGAEPFLVCAPPPPEQQIVSYDVYQDGVLIGDNIPAEADGSLKMDAAGIAPAVYSFTVEAINVWGESAPSNPYISPSSATAPVGVSLRTE